MRRGRKAIGWTYLIRNVSTSKNLPKRKKINFKFKLNKKIKIFAIAAVCVAALACMMMFIDGNFSKEVFNTVKTAYSSVFIGNKPTPISAKIELPSNVDLVEVNEGVATFRAAELLCPLPTEK